MLHKMCRIYVMMDFWVFFSSLFYPQTTVYYSQLIFSHLTNSNPTAAVSPFFIARQPTTAATAPTMLLCALSLWLLSAFRYSLASQYLTRRSRKAFSLFESASVFFSPAHYVEVLLLCEAQNGFQRRATIDDISMLLSVSHVRSS